MYKKTYTYTQNLKTVLEKVDTESGVYVLDLSITKVELIVNGDDERQGRERKAVA